MSEISEAGEMLGAEWRNLQKQWEAARQRWQDPVAEAFELEFWSELEHEVPPTLRAISELDRILGQALARTSGESEFF